jgi:mono/diheme cytochrome c family protein
MIKKWLPFIFLLVIILGSSSYLVLGNKKNNYKPNTDNPKVIYREACMHCHGDKGQGTGLLYPAFEDIMNKSDIEDAIIKGSFLMPEFHHINGDTLKNLVEFIHSKSFNK